MFRFISVYFVIIISMQFCYGQNESDRLGKLKFPEMVLVKGGKFKMGDPEYNQNTITVSTFYIAKTETTVLQYRLFCEETGTRFPKSMQARKDDEPIGDVSWKQAGEYARWLSKKTGRKYRLPTESEWEYAARGGIKTLGYKYSGSDHVDNVAYYITISTVEATPSSS